jgi:hypothetical protein
MASRARSRSAVRRTSACSAPTRAEMSFCTPTKCVTRPASSRMGAMRSSFQKSEPSLR